MRKTAASCGWILLFLAAHIGYAQDAAAEVLPEMSAEASAETVAAESEEPAISEERQNEIDRMEMELKVSSLLELAEWCRDLGLSEAGTKEALIARLRTALELPNPAPEEEGAQVIIIESARTTEYFSVSEVNEDYARLSGGVVVTLKDDTATYRISAWEMLYNRTRNILSATGGVEYLKENGDTRETFSGESITINLDTWAGMFIDSISEKSVAGGDTAYRFTGAIISQNGEEASVLRNAKITNAKSDEPYWSLTASRLWLLPGTDWALLNGVLKVGEIPVLWIPAFFWPSDEFLFHPVVGTRTREGVFFQTTTYIWGKAKADPEKESSISKIMGSGADMEKERQGLFLRTTGRKSLDTDSKRWSISFDGYSNLGFYLGTDLVLPAKGHFGVTNLTAGLGFSRNVYPVGTIYSPFIGPAGPNGDTENILDRDWNTSRLPLIPADLPFRYRFKIDGSYTAPFASFRWNFPLYSDPNIDRDFYLNRSETFDWFTLLKGSTEEEEMLSTTTLGSYSWAVSANSTVPVKALSPYISSLTLSNLSTTLEFASKTTTITGEMFQEDPKIRDHLLYSGYYFYYPNKWTAYSLSGSIAGTPLTLGNRDTSVSVEEESTILNDFGTPRAPWEEAGETATATTTLATDISPRPLSQMFSPTKDNGLRFTIGYSLTPSSATELNFRTAAFDRRENIDFTDIQKTQTRIRTDGSTTFTLSEPNNGLFSTSLALTGYAEWQKSKLIPVDEDNPTPAEETAEEAENTTNYKATQFNSVYRFSTNIKPLYWHEIFGASTITHTLEGKFLRWEFDPASYVPQQNKDDPQWDFIKGEWDREDITAHSTGININASVFDKTQTLSLSASLPPLFQNYSYSLTLRAWISETSVSGSYREIPKTGQSSLKDPETDMKIQPHTFTETLTFGTGKSLRQTIVYDPDPDHEYFTSAVTALSFGPLSAQYTASRVNTWQYKTSGWEQDLNAEPAFQPVSFTLGYNPTIKQDSVLNNMLSFNIGLTSSLYLDLLRYNFSRFTLGLNVKATVSRFADISIGFVSENASIYRYLKDIPGFQIEGAPPIGGETNIFKDLLDSFNFFDMDKRRGSGFKMKSLNLNLVHHLGDWDAVLDVKLTPYLDGTDASVQRSYRFNTEIAFIVRWIPISEIKTDISYNEKTDRFTQK